MKIVAVGKVSAFRVIGVSPLIIHLAHGHVLSAACASVMKVAELRACPSRERVESALTAETLSQHGLIFGVGVAYLVVALLTSGPSAHDRIAVLAPRAVTRAVSHLKSIIILKQY
jgi:hypothetical protein